MLTFGDVAGVEAVDADEEDMLVLGMFSVDCSDGTGSEKKESATKDGGESHCGQWCRGGDWGSGKLECWSWGRID
jgi:hypothetical protein